MSVHLFPDHLVDTRGLIRRAHDARTRTVLVRSFLQKAYLALRDEVWTLPSQVRNLIPPFNSVYDLSERHEASKVRRLEVSSALLSISQLAHFIGHYESNNSAHLDVDQDVLVGLGLGQLSAAAIACASTVIELPDVAVEAVRLSFRIGSLVERFSIQSRQYTETDEGWSLIAPGTPEEIKAELDTLQNEANIPISARAFVATISESACTINGNPSRLGWLQEQSKLLRSAPTQTLPTVGVWHTNDLYNENQVLSIIESSSVAQLSSPRHSVISTSSGANIEASDAVALFTEVVNDILRKPINWSAVTSSVTESVVSWKTTNVDLVGFEQCHMTTSLDNILQRETTQAFPIRDLAAWAATAQSLKFNKPASSNIAVVGMSGRFPGAPDVEALWTLLAEGRDMHKEVPKDRFDVSTHYDPEGKKNNTSHTPYGCFIEQPGLFDPRFFNMSPREATQTDPMHRLALVTAYEALEQSGFVLNSTPSSQQDRVGTFYGQTSDDWREVNAAQHIETYFIPGGVRAFAPGRISYYFGFRGPSYSVDTACSSSLAAIQIACSSLKSGECDTAVAGGLNVLTAPDIFAGLSKGQFLSKTGTCKTWDSKADGYCRADGVGSVVLKRMDDAVADNDNILGVILATATNHSADAISITHPHAGNQAYLYESVMHDAGRDPLEVSYVEMHGTGTQAGDMAEIKSVSTVFAPEDGSRGQSSDKSVYIGAVKSNIGHGEAAAGIGALIKMLLMFRKQTIPRHIGIKHGINPGFPDITSRNIKIAFENTPWVSKDGKPRLAFLNNFSAAGGNTAMLIEEGPSRAIITNSDPRPSLPFVVSAKSLTSMQRNIQQISKYSETLSSDDWSSLSYTLTSRRIHHSYRIGVTASSFEELRSALLAKAQDKLSPVPSNAPKVAFVFTGQGAYYKGLAKQLISQSAEFRSQIQHLDTLARNQGFGSFMPALDDSEVVLTPLIVQLALVSVQISLVNLWLAWGIKPSIALGHSMGEYGALYAAGVLSMEDTIYLVGRRATLLQDKCTANSHVMLAVKASVEDIESVKQSLSYEIACLNSPTDTVLSGSTAGMNEADKVLRQAGFKTTLLNLPYAFHSAQIEPILGDFEQIARGVVFNKPNIPIMSPLLGEVVESEGVFDPVYLGRHAREAVDFVEAIETAKMQNYITDKTVFVELGPHPICSGMIKSTLTPEILTVASLNKAENPWKSLSKAINALHCAGLPVDWREFHRGFGDSQQLLNVPTYSFDDKNYWIDYVNDWCLHKVEPRGVKVIEEKEPEPEPVYKLSTTSVHRVISQEFNNAKGKVVAQSSLSDPVLLKAISGHQVNNTALCPSSVYADMALTLGNYIYKEMSRTESVPGINCGDMEVFKPLIVKGGADPRVLELTIEADLDKSKAVVRFASIDKASKQKTLHATCSVTYEDSSAWLDRWNANAYLIEGRIDTLRERLVRNQADKISRGLAYRLFSSFVDYKPAFQGMEEVIMDGPKFEAFSRVNFQTKEEDGSFFCSPYFIDSLCHLSGFILNGSNAVDSRQFVYISHGWKSMRFSAPIDRNKTYHAYVKMQPAGNNIMAGDVYIMQDNVIIGVTGGIKFQRIPRTLLNSFLPPQPAQGSTINTATPTEPRRPSVQSTKKAVEASKPAAPAKAPKVSRSSSKPSLKTTAPVKPAQSIVSSVMEVISQESELPLAELQDECEFLSLGIDSLLSLQILGKLRETLDLDLPGNVFLDCPTIGELKTFLTQDGGMQEQSAATSPSILSEDEDDDSDDGFDSASSTSSAPSLTSIKMVKERMQSQPPPSHASAPPKATTNKTNDLVALFRETISEQMGVALEEVVGGNDLLSLGMDSLMSICILGILREKTELELDSHFFQTYNSMDAIEEYFRIQQGEPEPTPEPVQSSRKNSKAGRRHSAQPTTLPPAVSILMQGKPRSATKTLFLFPDGSGSATSYATIPAIDPSVAVYGLNCPYMTTPSEFTNGIPGVAAQYLAEIQRRQPKGPYHLGGWSAGGVIAYEVTIQLLAAGERVDNLVLFDSPCPIDLEPLPPRFHRFLAEVGLLGDHDNKVPNWLLPHFEASVRALTEYKPQPIPKGKVAPRTLAIWAQHGVCRYPDDPRPEMRGDEPRTMKWLLENRTDFGSNGWERLLGKAEIKTMSIEGHHFSLMKDKSQLQLAADAIKNFL